jgi:CheY-like chemotaxis protein/HPt (histidine-containing phosphotransfer) domain-containing protein
VTHTADADLRDLFEEEAREELDALELLLPRLGQPGAMAELRRHAHTVKGSSAIMGLVEVNEVAAALEQLFETLETSPEAAGTEVESSIRATVADLRFLVSGALGGLDVGNVGADATQALHTLEAAIGGGACPGCARLEARVEALERAIGTAPAPARHGALVVVDDSRTVRERHRSVLTAVGYDVRTAADGAEALRLLSERPADAVITDLDMPGMDGLRLTEAIRERPELSRLPVLVVSSHGDDQTRHRLLGAGADAFLPKDRVDGDKLVAQVDRLIEGSA